MGLVMGVELGVMTYALPCKVLHPSVIGAHVFLNKYVCVCVCVCVLIKSWALEHPGPRVDIPHTQV